MKLLGGLGFVVCLAAMGYFVGRESPLSSTEMIALAIGVVLSGAAWMATYFDQIRRGK